MDLALRNTFTGAYLRFALKITWLNVLVILTAVDNTANADCTPMLYGVAYKGSDGLASFYSIDPVTGVGTLIGPVGFERVSGMDVDPATNIIYATGELTDGSDSLVLITIDRATGAGTLIGATGITQEPVAGLSIRNSDSTIFGFGASQGVYTIDSSDGSATALGEEAPGAADGNGIAFSPADVLYHADSADDPPENLYGVLQVVDQTTGLLTDISDLSYTFAVDVPKVAAMDFAPDSGLYYAIVKDGSDGESILGTLDVTSGVLGQIGPTADFMDALTYFCEVEPTPDILIEKATNGIDADTAPGPKILVGALVTWTYVVTNTGNVTLTGVAVGDDQVGVNPVCDWNNSSDVGTAAGILSAAETVTCTATGAAIAGQYANLGDVAGTPPVGNPVTDTDPSHYLGVASLNLIFADGFESPFAVP